jgi:hypothetical protein
MGLLKGNRTSPGTKKTGSHLAKSADPGVSRLKIELATDGDTTSIASNEAKRAMQAAS